MEALFPIQGREVLSQRRHQPRLGFSGGTSATGITGTAGAGGGSGVCIMGGSGAGGGM